MPSPACEFCGSGIRSGRQAVAESFSGRGLPTDEELGRLLAPNVVRRAAARTGSGWLHNEGRSLDKPRTCYRAVLDVHNQRHR